MRSANFLTAVGIMSHALSLSYRVSRINGAEMQLCFELAGLYYTGD